MENTGQACNAGKRFIVADDLYDDFVATFTERMLAARTGAAAVLGGRRQTLEEQVDRAVAEGAHLAAPASAAARSSRAGS